MQLAMLIGRFWGLIISIHSLFGFDQRIVHLAHQAPVLSELMLQHGVLHLRSRRLVKFNIIDSIRDNRNPLQPCSNPFQDPQGGTETLASDGILTPCAWHSPPSLQLTSNYTASGTPASRPARPESFFQLSTCCGRGLAIPTSC